MTSSFSYIQHVQELSKSQVRLRTSKLLEPGRRKHQMAAKSFGDLRVGTECRNCTGVIIGLARLRNPLLVDIHQKTKGPKKKTSSEMHLDVYLCARADPLCDWASERAIDRALARSEKSWGPGWPWWGRAAACGQSPEGQNRPSFWGYGLWLALRFLGPGLGFLLALSTKASLTLCLDSL